jgi:hypothetical protein
MKELAILKKEGQTEPYVKFLLHQEGILIMQWKGFVKGDLIKHAHEVVFEHIKKHNITAIVEDVVNFSGPFQDVNAWFISTWVPQALSLGLTHAAVIMSKNFFTQLSVNDLKENPTFKQLGLAYRIFDNLDQSVGWIKEKELLKS